MLYEEVMYGCDERMEGGIFGVVWCYCGYECQCVFVEYDGVLEWVNFVEGGV